MGSGGRWGRKANWGSVLRARAESDTYIVVHNLLVTTDQTAISGRGLLLLNSNDRHSDCICICDSGPSPFQDAMDPAHHTMVDSA